MERRFVSLDFEKGTIRAYVAIAGNMPLRVMTLDAGTSEHMRACGFDREQIEQFRCDPTRFGRTEGDAAA